MVLKVVDISSHQSVTISTEVGAEGCIVKATQGTGYVNPKCDAQYQHAKKNGLKLGAYHYAGGGDPVAEADYFLKNIQGYIGEAILVLDWEEYQNAQYNNMNWCRQFVDRIHEKTGIWCIMYGNRQDANRFKNVANDCGLWFAGFPDLRASWEAPSFPYNIAPWKNMVGWQYTTSNGTLDRNHFYITREQWDKYAKSNSKNPKPENPKPIPEKPSGTYDFSGKSLETIASDVVSGKVGDGEDRKTKLGGLYNGVQAIINHRANPNKAGAAVNTLAAEVKAGRLGNGEARKKLLGTYYKPVQDAINGSATTRVYTVKAGDTLSGIGSKLGVDWKTLASKNGISNPNAIRPGQQIKY